MLVRSYRSAFILLFTGLLVLTTTAVAWNAYRRASQVSLGLSAEIIDQMAERVADRALSILEDAYRYLETDALLVGDRGMAGEREQVLKLFWRQLELSPQLLSIYAADPGGSFLQVRREPQLVTRWIDRSGERPREQLVYRDRAYAPIAHIEGGGLFDPRERPWFIGAQAAQGKVSWSSVYRFASVEKAGITASKTVYGADGKPLMILGIDIALEGLSALLGDQPLTKGAVALIVDERDRLVAYPYQVALRERDPATPVEDLPSVDDLLDPALIQAYRTIESTTAEGQGASAGDLQGFEVTRTDGVHYIARIHRFPSHWTEGWQLVVVVPKSSILSTAERLLSESAVISLIILLAALFLVSLLAIRLFKPLGKLVKNTELVHQLRFSEVKPVRSRFLEIQAMDRAICGMKQGLETLERFVPAAVARGLIQSGTPPTPDAQVRELTLFCGGMARFGRLCAGLPPERISALLTDQLDRFTRILMRQKGTVDDYLGESLLAFWGAPGAVEDGPARACLAALQCLKAESELAQSDPAIAPDLVQNLFAVHAGPCIVGNIGSQRYLAYTAIGDNVELVWRLKQQNRRYGTRILVTAPIREAVADEFWFRRLDLIPVHDGTARLAIYELQGERSLALPVEDQLYARAYERALDDLLAGDFESADVGFSALLAERPRDPALHLMRRRCLARSLLPCSAEDDLEPQTP